MFVFWGAAPAKICGLFLDHLRPMEGIWRSFERDWKKGLLSLLSFSRISQGTLHHLPKMPVFLLPLDEVVKLHQECSHCLPPKPIRKSPCHGMKLGTRPSPTGHQRDAWLQPCLDFAHRWRCRRLPCANLSGQHKSVVHVERVFYHWVVSTRGDSKIMVNCEMMGNWEVP